MNSQFKKHYFDHRGISRVREVLAADGALSRALQTVRLEDGRAWTWLPMDARTEELEHFDAGGVSDRERTLAGVSWLITEVLRRDPQKCCLLEDSVSLPEDEYLRDSSLPIKSLHGHIYYMLTCRDSQERVFQSLRQAYSYRLAGCLCAIPAELGSPESVDLNIILNLAAARAEHILVDAYDGEAIVIWTRDDCASGLP